MIVKDTILKLIEIQIAGTDIFLVEVKITAGKITVLIDKPSGISISECIKLNRYLVEELEKGTILDTHELEVSSPGMDQPLKVFDQYLRRIGREVQIITTDGNQFQGKLITAIPEAVEIIKTTGIKQNKKKETSSELIRIPFETIKETKLILTF